MRVNFYFESQIFKIVICEFSVVKFLLIELCNVGEACIQFESSYRTLINFQIAPTLWLC